LIDAKFLRMSSVFFESLIVVAVLIV